MIKLDRDLLVDLGLGDLDRAYHDCFLRYVYEVLEIRIGMLLANQMSEAQLEDFEKLIDRADEDGATAWLTANFPHYREVVQEEFEKLKAEIRAGADEILAMEYPDAKGEHAA